MDLTMSKLKKKKINKKNNKTHYNRAKLSFCFLQTQKESKKNCYFVYKNPTDLKKNKNC